MRDNRLWGYNWFAKRLRFFDFARCARNESRVAAHAPETERMDRFYSDRSGDCSQCKRTLEHRLVALGL